MTYFYIKVSKKLRIYTCKHHCNHEKNNFKILRFTNIRMIEKANLKIKWREDDIDRP